MEKSVEKKGMEMSDDSPRDFPHNADQAHCSCCDALLESQDVEAGMCPACMSRRM